MVECGGNFDKALQRWESELFKPKFEDETDLLVYDLRKEDNYQRNVLKGKRRTRGDKKKPNKVKKGYTPKGGFRHYKKVFLV